jgi:hypothetical protein
LSQTPPFSFFNLHPELDIGGRCREIISKPENYAGEDKGEYKLKCDICNQDLGYQVLMNL